MCIGERNREITNYIYVCHSCKTSGKNNPFYGKHHSDALKRKIVETKIRNGTLGYFPKKRFTLLRIVKELHDAGVDKDKIASLTIKQMKENGIKISKTHAYRVLPQEYKTQKRVIASRNSRIRKLRKQEISEYIALNKTHAIINDTYLSEQTSMVV
jgi:hypothetical protein